MSQPKVLRVLIIRNAYQKDAGGAEQYALNLAIALKEAGHIPLLVTKVRKIQRKASVLSVKHLAGPWHDTQKWDRLYYFRYPLFTLWYIWIILSRRVDIVHPQSRDDFVFATRAARLLGKPVLWTDHADLKYVLDNVNHYNPRMRKWVVSAAKQAKKIIAASHNEMQEIESVAPELNNLTVIHNGVFVPKNVNPVNKTNDFIIGTNSRLVETKGIGELIEGFAALERKDIDLWLLGGVSGNKDKYEKLAAELKVIDRVKFLDYVDNPNDYVASMDIFVHSSYHEAFSLAVIEAAMLARPIVATEVGGTPEIIDNTCGILIKPRSSNEITKALKKLLANKALRDKLAVSANNKAMSEFDFQKLVDEKIIALYRKALQK